MTSSLQEKLLLLRLRKKDPDAFAQLYDIYVTPIYRFIYFKVSTRDDAEDLTSEVFLRVWQYITESDQSIKNLRSLLYKTARNLVIDFYRRRSTSDLVGDEAMMIQIQDNTQQKLLLQIEAQLEVENLESVLRRMKDEYREVLVLRYIEELSISEIAEVLNKSKGSVRVIIHRALKVLKDLAG